VDPELLRGGATRVREFGTRAVAEVAVLEADPAVRGVWLAAAVAAVSEAL
jgi:hypothetical protein